MYPQVNFQKYIDDLDIGEADSEYLGVLASSFLSSEVILKEISFEKQCEIIKKFQDFEEIKMELEKIQQNFIILQNKVGNDEKNRRSNEIKDRLDAIDAELK